MYLCFFCEVILLFDMFMVNVNGYVAYKVFDLILITLLFQTFNNIVLFTTKYI